MVIELDTNEVQFILNVLGEQPAKSGVWPLIVKIKDQAEAQIPKEEPKEDLEELEDGDN